MAALQTTSPPTWQCHSSTRHWPRWTSCKRWPLVLSISLGFSHPVENIDRWYIITHVYYKFIVRDALSPLHNNNCPGFWILHQLKHTQGSLLQTAFALHTSTTITFGVSSSQSPVWIREDRPGLLLVLGVCLLVIGIPGPQACQPCWWLKLTAACLKFHTHIHSHSHTDTLGNICAGTVYLKVQAQLCTPADTYKYLFASLLYIRTTV